MREVTSFRPPVTSTFLQFPLPSTFLQPTLTSAFRLQAKSPGSRADPAPPHPRPLFSFASSFGATALPAPLLALGASEYFHEPLAFIVPVVSVMLFVSIPYALLSGVVASIAR